MASSNHFRCALRFFTPGGGSAALFSHRRHRLNESARDESVTRRDRCRLSVSCWEKEYLDKFGGWGVTYIVQPRNTVWPRRGRPLFNPPSENHYIVQRMLRPSARSTSFYSNVGSSGLRGYRLSYWVTYKGTCQPRCRAYCGPEEQPLQSIPAATLLIMAGSPPGTRIPDAGRNALTFGPGRIAPSNQSRCKASSAAEQLLMVATVVVPQRAGRSAGPSAHRD
jgi:hypothetical protein